MDFRQEDSSDEEDNGRRGNSRFWSLVNMMIPGVFMNRRVHRGRKATWPTAEADSANCENFIFQSLKGTDLGFKVMYESGASSLEKVEPIMKLLREREQGTTAFTPSKRCYINSTYMPNHLEKRIRFKKKLFCGTFSREGDYFVSGCQDAMIRVYRPGPGGLMLINCFRTLHMGWSILDIALNSDSSKLVYTSWSDYLYMCDVQNKEKPQESLFLNPGNTPGYSFCLFSLVFSHDDKELLGGANGGDIYVYNLERNDRTLKVAGHDDDVNTVCFADESSEIFISGGDDGLCKVWDRRTLDESNPEPVGVHAGHQDGITFIDSKKDGRCFLSNSKDQTIKLWDMRKFSSKDTIKITRREVAKRNWDYRWQRIPSSKIPMKIEGDISVMTYRGHEVRSTLIRARFSPTFTTGQQFIYSGCATGKVFVFDVLTGDVVTVINGHTNCTRDVSWHPYESVLTTTSWDHSIGYWTYSEQGNGADDERSLEDICYRSGSVSPSSLFDFVG